MSALEVAHRIAYVGAGELLHVYTIEDATWTRTQQVRCAASGLVNHPALPVLYATDEVTTFNGRPSGAVHVYRIGNAGQLALLQEKELSLSATLPRAIAVSTDGALAVVACSGGGLYNLLRIHADGRLGELKGTWKETGCGPHRELQTRSHPQHVCFAENGDMLGADLGTDRIHWFTFENGSFQLKRRYQAEAGSGPAHIRLHGTAPFFAASHRLRNTVGVYRYDATLGSIGPRIAERPGTIVPLQAENSLLAIQERARLTIFRGSSADGSMRPLRDVQVTGNVRWAHVEKQMLTFAAGDEIWRRHLADETHRCVAICPGLRTVMSLDRNI